MPSFRCMIAFERDLQKIRHCRPQSLRGRLRVQTRSQFWLHITACSRRTSSPILQNLVFGTHTPLTAASTLTKSKVCADHPFVRSAAHTHNEKPNGGAMPPGYSSRDDRCGIVRVVA